MEGFKPIFEDSDEKFGAFDAEDAADLTIHLKTGESIETEAVGIDADENICRHFTWEEFDEETIRKAIEDEPITYEQVMEESDVEFGDPFMMMNGLLPWDSVEHIEIDTKGLF